uniref:Aldose 1-epimerase n=1 Tax=Opalinidae sp. TaxID=2059444 RepID=A0A649UYY2_9STRA|nr:aldose 1-epimerase [Opalinidae sp.]
MKVEESDFGSITIDNNTLHVKKITFSNDNGYCAEFISLGARLISFKGPTKTNPNAMEELTLNYPVLEPMYSCGGYYGCTVGRYANRIAKGTFTLDGTQYKLATNNGNNHLHGGIKGYDKYIWKYELINNAKEIGVLFSHISPDMDEGYPGEVSVNAKYTLNNKNELKWEFIANSNKKTIINITNHTYWNLSGDIMHRDIRDHLLKVVSRTYLPAEDMIPTGEFKHVEDTNFDFKESTVLGPRLDAITDTGKPGLDHCFVFDGNAMFPIALMDPVSKRRLQLSSNQPGIQLYTANWLDGAVPHTQHRAIAFEPQMYPDSINHENFPQPILLPDRPYKHTTTIRFDFYE